MGTSSASGAAPQATAAPGGRGSELWDCWGSLAGRLAAGPLLACFDYDGTLVPIRPTPEEAVADGPTRDALARLAACDGVRVAVVSGRPAAQLGELLPLRGLWLVGTHGLETVTPAGEVTTVRDLAQCAAALEPLRARAAAIANLHPGVRVEDKGAALALHTRLADRVVAGGAADLFESAAAEIAGFHVMHGKEVLEARPQGADKGSAVVRLRAAGEAILYAGDDVTDEDAFAALAADPGAVTVRIGRPRPTAARYLLEGQEDVAELLARLIALRGGGGTGS